jgi:uncharacterized protein YaiI (UPF0178 family)
MLTIYVDADACPVKDEVYRVAKRYQLKVFVVANMPMRVPTDPLIELVVCRDPGLDIVDNWIAEQAGRGDIVITSDIPLAARVIEREARVIDGKGRLLTDVDIGGALAVRNIMDELRGSGLVTGGPAPRSDKDRSRFLAKLDETINAIRKAERSAMRSSAPIAPPKPQ